ncbi:hypothetical protein DPSP01_009814 [Paraphaeosphaeria sporulosa]
MQWGYHIHDLRATINWALSAMPKIILYDFPSREPCAAWLPSAWKARMALNYKKIDYETQWVEYPDVAPLAKSLGIPPGEGPGLPYTIPIMTTAGGEHIMDSKKIVDYLEEHYAPPDYPSLHLDSPILARVTEQMPGIMQRWASSVCMSRGSRRANLLVDRIYSVSSSSPKPPQSKKRRVLRTHAQGFLWYLARGIRAPEVRRGMG